MVVRPWSETDLEDAFRIYSNPEVMRYLGSTPAPIPDREKMMERMQFWKERDRDLLPGLGFWAIEREGVAIGSVILRPLPNDTKVEVGWHLGREHWGGYATEAARGAIARGFTVAGLDEIFCIIYPENTASVRVAERLGLESLGTTTAYHDLELLFYRIAS
ncbi:MAG: GNAT family N-acetyltransferase [Fimbriimonadales bacterium]